MGDNKIVRDYCQSKKCPKRSILNISKMLSIYWAITVNIALRMIDAEKSTGGRARVRFSPLSQFCLFDARFRSPCTRTFYKNIFKKSKNHQPSPVKIKTAFLMLSPNTRTSLILLLGGSIESLPNTQK